MDSFRTSSRPSNGSDSPSAPVRRRRRWGKRLLARLRGRWLLQAAAVLLFAVILGLLAALFLDRL